MHTFNALILSLLFVFNSAQAAVNCQSDLTSGMEPASPEAQLGATITKNGAQFKLWAPNAQAVEVLCEADWSKPTKLEKDPSTGIWQGHIPGAGHGHRYKFKIRDAKGQIQFRNDPHARFMTRDSDPGNWDSVIWDPNRYQWQSKAFTPQKKLRLMEVNPRTRVPGKLNVNFRELAHHLLPILKSSSVNTVSLMPVSHHNVVESWGYQPGGIFAVNYRHGNPDDLKYFIDLMHQNQIAVIFDVVIGHASKDWDTGLGGLDGTQLYFHDAPHLGEHRDWGTYIYNFARPEVRDFLISNVLYWIREFKIDGLRLDGVTSMLYLDYSRPEHEKALIWKEFGTNINHAAIQLIKDLNRAVKKASPHFISIAEESSGWPGVTHPLEKNGLGFDYMWGMGGMHHMRSFLKKDSHQRDLNEITAPDSWNEKYINYVNSHDETAHGKLRFIEMINGASGSERKFDMARLVTAWMYVMRGYPMLFQGDEIADVRGWNHNLDVQEHLLQYEPHAKFHKFVRDLGALHEKEKAFSRQDQAALRFLNLDNTNKVLALARFADSPNHELVVVMNFGDQSFGEYRIPSPGPGSWEIAFNSDSNEYGGANTANVSVNSSEKQRMPDSPYTVTIKNLPARTFLILKRKSVR